MNKKILDKLIDSMLEQNERNEKFIRHFVDESEQKQILWHLNQDKQFWKQLKVKQILTVVK